MVSAMSLRVRQKVLRELETLEPSSQSGGRIVFLVGERGSGRSDTLREFASQVNARRKNAVAFVGLRFVDEQYTVPIASPQGRDWREVAFGAVGSAGTAAAIASAANPALVPIAVAAQLVQTAGAVGNLGLSTGRLLKADMDGSESRASLLTTIRRASSKKPVICILDDFSRADRIWWHSFIRDGAPEISRLPVLIIAAVDRPDSEQGEAAHEFMINDLIDEGIGLKIYVERYSHRELRGRIGGVESNLLADLLRITGGSAGFLDDLWTDLVEFGDVIQDKGRWMLRSPKIPAEQDGASLTLGMVLEIADKRIKDLCRDDEEEAEIAHNILRIAALEGTTFTPIAVARTARHLASAERPTDDDVFDLLDDKLALSAEKADGLLLPHVIAEIWNDGSAEMHAFRCDFLSNAHVAALEQLGFTSGKRRQVAATLAHILEIVYSGNLGLVAAELERLFRLAGDPDTALSYARQIGRGKDPQRRYRMLMLLLGSARSVTDLNFVIDEALDLGEAVVRTHPNWADELGRLVLDKAGNSWQHTIRALILLADTHRSAGNYREALSFARQVFTALGQSYALSIVNPAKTLLASCLVHVHNSERHQGLLDEAVTLADEVIETSHKFQNCYFGALSVKADALGKLGRLEEALSILLSIVAQSAETGDIRSLGSRWRNIGCTLIDLGRIDEAEKALVNAYKANTAAGDLVGKARTSSEHGYALLCGNQYSSARWFLLRALDEWIALGAPQGPVSSVIGWLAQAAKGEGRTELAQQLRDLNDEFKRVPSRLSRGGRNDLELAKVLKTRTELALAARAAHAEVLGG